MLYLDLTLQENCDARWVFLIKVIHNLALDASMDTTDCAIVNSDIAGIGVRVSFYSQTLFLGVFYTSILLSGILKRSWQCC
jgi:hypothetical protein